MLDSWQPAISWFLLQHREFHRQLGEAIRAAHDQPGEFLLVAVLALAVGMLHALTPGHGKIVLFSYFMGRAARPWAGLVAAAQLSAVHVSLAVILVTLIGGSVQVLGRPAGAAMFFQIASAALVVLTGLWLAWRALRNWSGPVDATLAGEGPAEEGPAGGSIARRHGLAALPVALGLLPCPLTMLLMTYAMIHASYWLGLITVAVMAVGVMVTIATIGTAAILIRSRIRQGAATRFPHLRAVLRWLELASAAVIVLLGLTYLPAM